MSKLELIANSILQSDKFGTYSSAFDKFFFNRRKISILLIKIFSFYKFIRPQIINN